MLFSVVVALVVLAPSPAGGREDGGLLVRRSGYSFKRAEACFMKRINRVRARHGRRRLNWDKQLGYVARRHANVMATNRSVYHDSNMGSEITRWRALAQNTGGGRGCKRVFRAFMRSTSHRANILGRWRHVGVGVERRGGRIYVQQVFEYRADPGNIYHWP